MWLLKFLQVRGRWLLSFWYMLSFLRIVQSWIRPLMPLVYKAKPQHNFCAAYSPRPRRYYCSSQTSVLVTTEKTWLLTSFITTWGLKRKMFFGDKQFGIYLAGPSWIFLTFGHHLLMLIKWISALGAVASTLRCIVDQILTLLIFMIDTSAWRFVRSATAPSTVTTEVIYFHLIGNFY